jgi:lipoprotein-anchoring transpeptidase ErfK/SrfK
LLDNALIKEYKEKGLSLPKIVIIGSFLVFGVITAMSFTKKRKNSVIYTAKPQSVQEVVIEKPQVSYNKVVQEVKSEEKLEEIVVKEEVLDVDNIDFLFTTDIAKLPFVETITYTSRVPWLSGRPAWIADYAAHYETTRHFIARSLNKKNDYFTQKVSPGDRFNVLKKDVSFHLLIDLNRSQMRFYAIDEKENKRYLLKAYNVGLGRKEAKKSSGLLTPKGKFLLGSKVAIYKPGTMGYFQDKQIEMLRVFGTRWMPFEKEVENCTEGAKGFGIHGAPWFNDVGTSDLTEDRDKIGKYESDGCIRLFSEDIEELFAIIISKPTTVELVSDFSEATLPGEE